MQAGREPIKVLHSVAKPDPLESIEPTKSDVDQQGTPKRPITKPSRLRLPAELLNTTEKTKIATIKKAVNLDHTRKVSKPFKLPIIAPRPRRPPSPQFSSCNPALVNWSAQQAVQHTTTIAPNAIVVNIHNYHSDSNLPRQFGNPLELSRNQFTKFCRSVPKKTREHWLALRRTKRKD